MADRRRRQKKARQPKVAMISLHTSPQDPPGSGDAGGMNVYILSVARRLAEQGVQVDIFTRCHGQNLPTVQHLDPGSRLIQVQAGPCAPVRKEDLPALLPSFLDGVLAHAAVEGDGGAHRHSPYDVVHSHYWLSGWVGSRTKRIWGAPLVSSFHTLGMVKNTATPPGERSEPQIRVRGELRVVRHSDRILAPTPAEAGELVRLYDADPERIRVVAPGVDGALFSPKPRREARAALHMPNARLLLFVGRLQPLKGPDVAIRAVAEAAARAPGLTRHLVLAVVGGPTGAVPGGQALGRLMSLASELGVADRVVFFPPQPHERLRDFYAAAEAVILPSRSESFGLVALEAQACGTPVIGAAVGGLRYTVADGSSGMLVEGHDPGAYADRILALLRDPALARSMSQAAIGHAARFSWDATAAGLGEVYRELAGERAG
ncbi:MAG TPA: D-inositol-3-phosphate glycosyltransferase [Actinomycetota bacterium]